MLPLKINIEASLQIILRPMALLVALIGLSAPVLAQEAQPSAAWRVECSGDGKEERFPVQTCTKSGCLLSIPLKNPLLGFGLAFDKAK